jgi:hypothetical protein
MLLTDQTSTLKQTALKVDDNENHCGRNTFLLRFQSQFLGVLNQQEKLGGGITANIVAAQQGVIRALQLSRGF